MARRKSTQKVNRQVARAQHGEDNVNIWLAHRKQCEAPQPSTPPPETPHVHFAPQPTRSTDADDESLTDSPKYLDGGYGWVVVAFSFMLHFICDGLSFSFGLMFFEIQLKFAANRTATSVVASLFLSFPLLFSVVAGIYNDVHDCRKTIMTGGIVSFVCCICAYNCESFVFFTLFFGVGCGIGLSFLYNAALVVVTYYFNLKLGKATSLATSGTGLGTFCYPFYLTRFGDILHFFGWHVDTLQGMVLASAFSFLICAIIGYFLYDVEWTTDTTEYKLKKFEKNLKQVTEEFETPKTIISDCQVRRACSLPSIPTSMYNKLRGDSTSVQSVKEAVETYIEQPARSRSIGIFIRQQALPPVPEYSMIQNDYEHLKHLDLQIFNSPMNTVKSSRKQMTSRLSMSVDQINNMDEEEDFFIRSHLDSSTHSLSGTHEHHLVDEEEEEEEEEGTSDDSDLSNDGDSSSSELSERSEQTKLINGKTELTSARPNENPVHPVASVPSSARVVRNSLAQGMGGITAGRVMARNILPQRVPFRSNLLVVGKVPSAPSLRDRKKRRTMFSGRKVNAVTTSITDVLKEYMTVIKVPVFQIFLLNLVFLYIALDVPYVYFVDIAKDELGVTEERAKYLTSTIGISNIVSTLFYGWIADKQYVKERLLLFYGFFLSFSAVSMLIAYYNMSYQGLIIACMFFGASVSSNYIWQSIHVTLIFKDMSSFQAAYSLATTFEGIANFLGPIICGYIRDMSGDYTFVFLIAAIMMTISSMFAVLAHFRLIKERIDEGTARDATPANGQARQPIESRDGPENDQLITRV